MQSKRSSWYKEIGGGIYETTEIKTIYPKQDLRHWKMLTRVKPYGGLTIRLDSDRRVYIELAIGSRFNGVTGYFDLESLMLAAAIHDQLVEEGKLSRDKHPMLQTPKARKASDRVFKQIAKKEGRNLRARMLFHALRAYAKYKRLFKG